MRACPKQKRAIGGPCQVAGCDCRCARKARICKCCVCRCGDYAANKYSLLQSLGTMTQIAAYESELLATLAQMAPRLIESRGDGYRIMPRQERQPFVTAPRSRS